MSSDHAFPFQTRHCRWPLGSGYQPGGGELVAEKLTHVVCHLEGEANSYDVCYVARRRPHRDHRTTATIDEAALDRAVEDVKPARAGVGRDARTRTCPDYSNGS